VWEILADLAVLFGDSLVRALRARRAGRRLAAGKQTRIPCSVRSDRTGWPATYTSGSLLFTPGSPTAAFGSRNRPCLEIPVGGEVHALEPEAWYDADWAAKAYQPPGGGSAVHLQVHTRYHGIVLLAFRKI